MSDKRPRLLNLMRALVACLALALALFTATAALAQAPVPPSRVPFPQSAGQSIGALADRSDHGDPDPTYAARRIRALNDMRQKALVSDTNKLLKLAGEFDSEIRKTNSDSLTPDQLHKLATIEKLARSVKEKMSTPVAGMPTNLMAPAPMMH